MAKILGPRKVRSYSKEFKSTAVRLKREDENEPDIADRPHSSIKSKARSTTGHMVVEACGAASNLTR